MLAAASPGAAAQRTVPETASAAPVTESARGVEFQVPPGFVVEKVAAPPLVRYPLFACFDDQGRLYVAEGTGTNLPGEELRLRKLGRILLLEDRDGDGRFDTSQVFADGLVFPQGVLWHDGALYTASHPSIWRLEDPEGHGRATRRRELVSGFGFNGNGCDIHGPFLGPDGRLYWTDGRHGYTVPSGGATLKGLAARIWRCRTDGSEIERLCGGGFDNPVEVCFMPDGAVLGTMDQGAGDCLLHYVEGGVYPMEHPCLQEFTRTGPLLGAVKTYSPALPAALCGLARYRSSAFGPSFRDRLFSTQYMLHKLVVHELIPEGSTYRAADSDFLTTTVHDVRLTDVVEDADGSLLLVDMGGWFTYGFPGSPRPRPQALGAIYRVRRAGAARPLDPWGRGLARLAGSPAELIARLDDPLPKVQDRAAALLVKQGDAAVPALDRALEPARARLAELRRNAVWALCRIGTRAALGAALTALDDPDETVRAVAINTLGLHRDCRALSGLCAQVQSGTPRARRLAAEALGRIGRPAAAPALLAALRQGGDPFLEHSLIYALIQIQDRVTGKRALEDSDPRVQRAGLYMLAQSDASLVPAERVAQLLDSADAELHRAALWAMSRHREIAALARHGLARVLAGFAAGAAPDRSLEESLTALATLAPVQSVIGEAVTNRSTPAASRALLARVIGQAQVSPVPPTWVASLAQALDDPERSVRSEVIAAIRVRNLSDLDPHLLRFCHRTEEPAELRVAALEAVAARLGAIDEPCFALLADHLSDKTDPLLRLAAARALGVSPLSSEQQIALCARIGRASTMVLRLVLPVFAKVKDAEASGRLLEALKRNPSAEGLSVAELDQIFKNAPDVIRARAEGLRARLAARSKDIFAALARITRELETVRGDPDAGQELFLSARLGCFGCHRAVGRGGTVGPDLSHIGRIRSRAELLESLLFPSLTVAPEYRSIEIELRDGRIMSGLTLREDDVSIVLRRADLSDLRVDRSAIERMRPSALSIMPDGFERLVTRAELSNLLEFLVQQR
jgi:putative heme-binding domain-containing protein